MLVQVIKGPPQTGRSRRARLRFHKTIASDAEITGSINTRPTSHDQRLIWFRETYRKVSSLISFDDAFYLYRFLGGSCPRKKWVTSCTDLEHLCNHHFTIKEVALKSPTEDSEGSSHSPALASGTRHSQIPWWQSKNLSFATACLKKMGFYTKTIQINRTFNSTTIST